MPTPITALSGGANELYIKRDDLYPVSFGGNKARKGELFFREIDASHADCVVTYGSAASNHCRVIANLAAARGIPCRIITASGDEERTANSRMAALFGAAFVRCPEEAVHDTIERTLEELHCQGHSPFFIPGGGHGNTGTQAYVDAYGEILRWEEAHGVRFDYIFHASGTGTTQAGLVCGQLLNGDTDRKIVGISIARPAPRGRDIVAQSVRDYLSSAGKPELYRDRAVCFEDAYTCGGYGKVAAAVRETALRVLRNYGIPLCGTYTAKAFWGMEEYLKVHGISGRRILFVHTGGTPLFFDDLREWPV